MDLLDGHVSVEVVQRMLFVVLRDHMVAVLAVVFRDRGRRFVDFGVVVDVRRCVVSGRLVLLVLVLVVDDGLVVDSVVMVHQVLIEMTVLGVRVDLLRIMMVRFYVMDWRIDVLVGNLFGCRHAVVCVMRIGDLFGNWYIVVSVMAIRNLFGHWYIVVCMVSIVIVVMGSLLIYMIVVHAVSMIQLSVESMILFMADRPMVPLIMMLVAMAPEALSLKIVQLRPMVRVMVVRVGVLDVRRVIVHSLAVVRILVEIHWIVHVFMLCDGNVVTTAMHLMLSVLNIMRKQICCLINDSHSLAIARHQMSIELAPMHIEVGVSVPRALRVVLMVLHVVWSLVVSLIEGVRSHRWQLLRRMEDVLGVFCLDIVNKIVKTGSLMYLMVDRTSLSSVCWLKVSAMVDSYWSPFV